MEMTGIGLVDTCRRDSHALKSHADGDGRGKHIAAGRRNEVNLRLRIFGKHRCCRNQRQHQRRADRTMTFRNHRHYRDLLMKLELAVHFATGVALPGSERSPDPILKTSLTQSNGACRLPLTLSAVVTPSNCTFSAISLVSKGTVTRTVFASKCGL